ncbi:MAG: hypothetical protein ABWY52_08480 [Candidatus Limnocylindrales bacterium]
MPRPSHTLPAAVALVVIAIAACTSPATPTTPATSVEPTVAVDADHVIDLELTAELKIKQDGQQVSSIPVTQGETYTFRVTNSANLGHDFLIGSDADLSTAVGGLPGIETWNEGTREFQYTFDSPGPLAFGCTVPGHYALMKGVFDIQP